MNSPARRVVLGLLLIVGVAVPAISGIIQIGRPTLSVPSAETQRFLDDQIIRAINEAEVLYEDLRVGYQGFGTSVRAPRASIQVDIIAAEIPGSTFLVMNATGPGGASETISYQMPWTDTLYRELSKMFGFIDAVLSSGRATPRGNLAYLQDFVTDYIATGDMQFAASLYPYSLNTNNGNLLLAGGTAIVELDRFFREQRKIGVDAGVTGAWAMQVGVTEAGTLAAGSLSQGGVLRFIPGIPEPFRVPTRSATTSLAVADDGSIFTLDMNQQFLRIGNDGITPIELELPESTYITYMNTGPESTLWIWEPTHRSLFVFDRDGNRIDMVFPQVPFDIGLTMKFFQPLANGETFMVFGDRFAMVRPNGALKWEFPFAEIEEVLPNEWLLINQFHYDETTGTIYGLNVSSKFIYQVLDIDRAMEAGSFGRAEEQILEVNELLRQNPFDQTALADRARIYESLEAWELAAKTWEDAYGLNPLDSNISSAREEVVIRRLEVEAGRLYERAIRLIEQYGVSTAAYSYQRAQEVLEDLIRRSDSPGDAQQKLDELRRRYEETQNPTRERPPLSLDNIALADIFPSLFTVYQDQPAGTVTIRNTGTTAATEIRLSAEMRFLEFATPGGSLDSLGPGEQAELEIRLPISDRTLGLQESTPAPVNITVSYRSGNNDFVESEVEIITVHRATALTWDQSGKLAAYVTPRDSVVAEYAAPFVAVGDAERFGVSEKVFRAARISDAVGVSGLEYIEDPQSGITQVLGNPAALDTVRFPRNTIRVGYGDCDDTTALMCSLFESVGIGTAIMTSPGHVFMAFDTGEPEQNIWLFESETTAAIAHAGTVWLPYETTILHEGFLASWEEGSRLYKRYAPEGAIEFLPISDERDRFPAIPLETASFSVTPPPAILADPLYDDSVGAIRETLYVRSVDELESNVASQSNRRQVRTWNQIGILHGQFDEPRAAERAFERAIDIDPDYTASYVNLANLNIISGNGRAALEWLDEADERRSGTVIATLLRAQAEFLLGNQSGAAQQMALLERRAPDLAAQYPHLTGSTAGRASEAQSRPSLPWAVDDE